MPYSLVIGIVAGVPQKWLDETILRLACFLLMAKVTPTPTFEMHLNRGHYTYTAQ